jgi:hypothetical protein
MAANPTFDAATGQPAQTTVIDPLPIMQPNTGMVTFNMDATLKSPFFWLLVGAGATLLALYYFRSSRS